MHDTTVWWILSLFVAAFHVLSADEASITPCVDILPNCDLLDPTIYCVGDYSDWGFQNCRNTCKRCNDVRVCEYKGQTYKQNQTWQIGCEYSCICEDAAIGYYNCRSFCPQYTNLPPGCHLEKPAGVCCSQPTCLSTSVIG